MEEILIKPIGFVHSIIKKPEDAPKQGKEGAPDAWIEIEKEYTPGLNGLSIGDEVIIITWLHLSSRDILLVHPRGNKNNPLTGVFATRSPNRPNPLGLHKVVIKDLSANNIKVGPFEAIDGTPVVDIKLNLNSNIGY